MTGEQTGGGVKFLKHKLVRTEGEWGNDICAQLCSRGGEANERAVLSRRSKKPEEATAYAIIEWDPVEQRIRGTRLQLKNLRWEAVCPASSLFTVAGNSGTNSETLDIYFRINMDQFVFDGTGESRHASQWREGGDQQEWQLR